MLTPLARLTAILARTPGVPDSTPLTMGGEVELEVTMGDLRELASRVGTQPPFGTWRGRCGHLWERKDGDDESCPVCTALSAAEANLARAREIMKPFAALGDNWWRWANLPDSQIMEVSRFNAASNERAARTGLTLADFRAVSRFLTEGEGAVSQDSWRTGWRVVPAEPTEAMLEASWALTAAVTPDERMALELCDNKTAFKLKLARRYLAMIAAAPLLPEQGDGNG